MGIYNHWALMAATGVGLLALTFNLYEQGWDTHHWLYLILAPLWVYFIVELYRTDWDNQD